MPADSQKNPRNCKQGEHLFARFRSSVSPALNAGVHTLRKVIHLGHIQPGNITIIITVISVSNRFGRS